MSLVPQYIWRTIDMWWMCHTKTPTMAGWGLARTCLPRPGGVEEQEHWTMWAWKRLEGEFYDLMASMQPTHDNSVETSHEGLKKKYGLT